MIKFEKLPKNILSKIPEVKKVLKEDINVIFSYLFGGIAKAEVKPLSDIDIAVYIDDTANLPHFKLQLFDRLTDILGTNELDLIILNTAPLSLAGRILQNMQILTDKKPFFRYSYESITLRKFFDFKIKEDIFFSLRYQIGR